MNQLEINALVKKWQFVLDQAKHIFTWTEPACLAYCCERAATAKFAVELGTYMGHSAFVMLRANPKLHLWCVDLFNTAVVGTLEVSRYHMREEVKQGRVEFITGDSEVGAKMLQHMDGELDFVWVDDGHATEDVKRDIRSFLPLIRSGGEIFGHDFDIPHNDVALGVIASLPHYEIPVPRLWSYQKP